MDTSAATLLSKVGVGFIGIGSLSTLIGPSIAETLALGDRGAAGLPWAATSAFGIPPVIKACVAAPLHGWIREALGLRSSATDLSVGQSFNLVSTQRSLDAAGRKMQMEPVGVTCNGTSENTQIHDPSRRTTCLTSRVIYALDWSTYSPLQHTPPCDPEDNLKIRNFNTDPHYRDPIIKWDLIFLSVSLVKTIEFIVMCTLDAIILGALSALPWLYFFISAVILQQKNLSRGYIHDNRRVDIIAGQLPTPTQPGKARKVLLLAPMNFRTHYLWQGVWAVGAVLSTSSLIGAYIKLHNREPGIVYIWLGFQILWVILRSIYFHVSQDTMVHPILTEENIETMHSATRQRVLNLTFALANLQTLSHPRGSYCYKDDLLQTGKTNKSLQQILDSQVPSIEINLLNKCKAVKFLAVIGDTLLSSACWVYGSKLTGRQLYDSCIVLIDIQDSRFAVPAARVLRSISEQREVHWINNNPPRGSPNLGPDGVQWVYWIPCSDGRWLEVRSENLRIMERSQTLVFRTDKNITEQFNSGVVKVDHTSADGIRDVVDLSNAASLKLRKLVTNTTTD